MSRETTPKRVLQSPPCDTLPLHATPSSLTTCPNSCIPLPSAFSNALPHIPSDPITSCPMDLTVNLSLIPIHNLEDKVCFGLDSSVSRPKELYRPYWMKDYVPK